MPVLNSEQKYIFRTSEAIISVDKLNTEGSSLFAISNGVLGLVLDSLELIKKLRTGVYEN